MSEAALHLGGRGSTGGSLAPDVLFPAMAEQGVAQQHSVSDVPESSWTPEKKKSLRVLAAAEVRCWCEAVAGELKARIPEFQPVTPQCCSQNSVWGPRAVEHVPLGLAVLKQPLLVLFLSPALTVPALRTWVRGYKSLNECRSPVRFRILE